jgi:hypothetical protein
MVLAQATPEPIRARLSEVEPLDGVSVYTGRVTIR